MTRDQYYAARYLQRSDLANPFRFLLPEHVKVMNRLSSQRYDLLAHRQSLLGSPERYKFPQAKLVEVMKTDYLLRRAR